MDLRAPGYDALVFDAVMTGLLAPGVVPVRRVSFPKGGIFAGESHRLTESGLAGGSGLSEAIATIRAGRFVPTPSELACAGCPALDVVCAGPRLA